MSAVSETITREYFELHGFFVRQQRKYLSNSRREEDEIDLFVINPRYVEPKTPPPFVLGSEDLSGIARALVVVKGWHTETFSTAVLANAPEIFRFLEPAALQNSIRSFGGEGPITRLLVVPALHQADEARNQSIELLKSKGIDAVIPFRTLLADLVQQSEVNRNYQKSDLHQIIRILKNYDFIREPQMELFKPRRSKK